MQSETTQAHKPKKKTGPLRWLDPDWSIVRWIKSIIYEEDEDEHPHSTTNNNNPQYQKKSMDHFNNIGNDFGGSSTEDMMSHPGSAKGLASLPSNDSPPAHAIAISSIFSFLVAVFGLYMCLRIMLPGHRFERNSNLTVFYLAAFSFLVIPVLFSSSNSEVVFHFHKKWDHQPTTITGVCIEVFRLASVLFYLSSITNILLITVNRRFKDQEKLQQWATFLRELNSLAAFICLACLIPLR